VAKADALRPRVAKDPDLLVRLAGAYALCADAAADAAEKRRHADQALEVLRAVVQAGYKDAVYLRTHPDLAPPADDPALRERLAKGKCRARPIIPPPPGSGAAPGRRRAGRSRRDGPPRRSGSAWARGPPRRAARPG